MNIYNEHLRDRLNQSPFLKKVLKTVFGGLLQHFDKHNARLYEKWRATSMITETEAIQQREDSKAFSYRPLISIIVPTYNTPPHFLFEMIESVRAQTYENWELILVDDASPNEEVRSNVLSVASTDGRIRTLLLDTNHHIAGATNEGIKIAQGEFVSLFDHDDLLYPDALFEIVASLNKDQSLNFIYTDEEKINSDGTTHTDLFFKPGWNPDFLASINYITHFTTILKECLLKHGMRDGNYNGAQDWELFLRLSRAIEQESIHHIPKILYSWRVHEASTAKSFDAKPYVVEAQRKALEVHYEEIGYPNVSITQDTTYNAQWHATFSPTSKPLVSIAVLADAYSEKFVNMVRRQTAYENIEFIAIEEDATYKDLLAKAGGEYIVFAKHGLFVTRPDWLAVLIGDAERKDIAFVMTKCTNEGGLNRNVKSLLGSKQAALVSATNVRALTKHFYATTRYNIPSIGTEVCIVEREKLQRLVVDAGERLDFAQVSTRAEVNGLRNLYNPYIKMVE